MGAGALALPLAQSGPVIPTFGPGDRCIRANGEFCLHWFLTNFSSRFLPRLGEHVKMTAIAIALGFVIALLAALLAYRCGRLELPFANLSAFFYTIPSIAFFQIMVPITGIGLLSIEIALVSYTLLILFRNILTGLREVPAEMRDAAAGMGFTRRQALLRIELPLALPTIIAGLRIATVTTISLASIAAYITPLGLGAPIFSAIQSGSNTELVGASLLSILLALVADALIVTLQWLATPWLRARGRSA
ncbi:MAG: ABC transporter permease [Solirubrobacteraceae bacterium]